MREMLFKVKSGSKEVPARFHGQELKLDAPTTLAEVEARFTDEVRNDPAKRQAAIDDLITGQGTDLSIQKWVKDLLDSEEIAKIENLAEALEAVRVKVNAKQFGEPRKRGEGQVAVKARAEKAEAKVSSLVEQLKAGYLAMPKAARKQFRQTLLDNGTFTEAELDEMDQQ